MGSKKKKTLLKAKVFCSTLLKDIFFGPLETREEGLKGLKMIYDTATLLFFFTQTLELLSNVLKRHLSHLSRHQNL